MAGRRKRCPSCGHVLVLVMQSSGYRGGRAAWRTYWVHEQTSRSKCG